MTLVGMFPCDAFRRMAATTTKTMKFKNLLNWRNGLRMGFQTRAMNKLRQK